MRGTRSSPIPIEDSEEEVAEELCNHSADHCTVEDLSIRLMDPPSPEKYASTSHKRKRDEIRTDYSDAFIQGSSSMPLATMSESRKAKKRRRRQERQALEAAEMLARARAQQSWYEQMSTVLYESSGGFDANVDMNMNMNMVMFHGIDSIPVYPTEDNTNVMHPYTQIGPDGPSEWVSAMALAGSLPDPSAFANQYQWPPPNGHSYSHAQPITTPPLSPSPPALLERVSSPILSTTNRLPPTALNGHSNTVKRSSQIIGMRPDNEPHSKHGVFHFSPGNLSFSLHNKPANVSNSNNINLHTYIPNPACTIVMEQLPKSHRTIEFVKPWAKQASGVMPVCILVDPPSAKALVEFPSARFSRKAWESPRLGSEYAGLKTHQLKGKPRVDQIRVWWYRVDGVGAGAGVGEIEEGEIEDDEVDIGQEQRFGHPVQQQQSQGRQVPPRQTESKKARKARLAREKQAMKPIANTQPNRNRSGSGLGHDLTSGMIDLTNMGIPVLAEPPIFPPDAPQPLRVATWKSQGPQVDMNLGGVSHSVLARQHRSPGHPRNNPNTGIAEITTPTSTDERAEARARHWTWDVEVIAGFNSDMKGETNNVTLSREEVLVRQPHEPSDARRCSGASSSSGTNQVPALPDGGHVTLTRPPSPPSSSATSTILKVSDLPQLASRQAGQGSQGTSPIDITRSISKPFASGPNLGTDITVIATSTPAIVSPSFRTLPKLPPSLVTRQSASSSRPRPTSVPAAPPLETLKETTPPSTLKPMRSQPHSVPVPPAGSSNSAPALKPSSIPISISTTSTGTGTTQVPGWVSERSSSSVVVGEGSTASAFTKLAEMKRALMAKQKELEEKIAKSKLEMNRLKESVAGEAKGDTAASSSPLGEGSKAMEDRLRKLVVQSQKTRSKSAEQQSAPPQLRSPSTSSSASSTITSPPVLTPPAGTGNVVSTTSSIQSFSLEDLAVSFITETISTLKQSCTPTLVSSPIVEPPSVSLVPVIPIPRSQLPSKSQVPESATTGNGSGYTTVKEELAERQKQLEQYITESKVLMTQLTQARTKQEKDRLLGLMREKTRLMDEEKETMANVANGANRVTAPASIGERASKPVMFIRWPTCSQDGGILVISDDEHDEDGENG